MERSWYLSDECDCIIVKNRKTGEKLAELDHNGVTTSSEDIKVWFCVPESLAQKLKETGDFDVQDERP